MRKGREGREGGGGDVGVVVKGEVRNGGRKGGRKGKGFVCNGGLSCLRPLSYFRVCIYALTRFIILFEARNATIKQRKRKERKKQKPEILLLRF